MKIALISSGFLPVVDGVTVTVMHRLQKLSQLGHSVVLFCPEYSSLAKIYPNWRDFTGQILPGVEVINLPSEPFMGVEFERNLTFKSYPLLLEKLRQFQPDIIHVDEPERLSVGLLKFAGVDYAKKNHIPCTSFFHTHFIEYTEDFLDLPQVFIQALQAIFRRTIPWTYNAYSATFVSSSTTYQQLIRLGIKNAILGDFLGVDLEQYQPQLRQPQYWGDRHHLPQLQHQTKLLFLGRLTADKGWSFTLDALPRLFQEIDPKHIAIVIAGDGDLRHSIAERLAQFTPHVHFLGRIPPEEVPALLLNSDIHITTSQKETRGLTVLEASAAGIPVLAARANGIIDSVQDGWNGLLFTPGDPQAFVQKLQRLIEDVALRQQLGTQARASVVHYTWDRAVQSLLTGWEAQIQMLGRK